MNTGAVPKDVERSFMGGITKGVGSRGDDVALGKERKSREAIFTGEPEKSSDAGKGGEFPEPYPVGGSGDRVL